MRDAYLRFFNKGYISKEQFFDFGLKETIYADPIKAENEWDLLKYRIYNNQEVFIRGFGRDAKGTHLFQAFYGNLLDHYNVKKDPTNNSQPAKLIKKLTGYSKTKSSQFEPIRNYQISHVFSRTKNVFAFMAPWNIVYIPKMLDPFTGHEAKGDIVDEYTILFQKQSYRKFENMIEEFNEIMTSPDFKNNIIESLDMLNINNVYDSKEIVKLQKVIVDELKPIII